MSRLAASHQTKTSPITVEPRLNRVCAGRDGLLHTRQFNQRKPLSLFKIGLAFIVI